MKLTSNTTILDVWPHLASPREYVAGARHKMETCLKQNGNARVVIGITGSGQKPCYRILFTSKSTHADEIYGSYWDNHEPLSREDAKNNNWATKEIDFIAVDTFLKEKIGWKK